MSLHGIVGLLAWLSRKINRLIIFVKCVMSTETYKQTRIILIFVFSPFTAHSHFILAATVGHTLNILTMYVHDHAPLNGD